MVVPLSKFTSENELSNPHGMTRCRNLQAKSSLVNFDKPHGNTRGENPQPKTKLIFEAYF